MEALDLETERLDGLGIRLRVHGAPSAPQEDN